MHLDICRHGEDDRPEVKLSIRLRSDTLHKSSPKLDGRRLKSVAWSNESAPHSNGWLRIRSKQHESMDPSWFVPTVQTAAAGVMMWRKCFSPLSINGAWLKFHSLPYKSFWPCPFLCDHSVSILWWRLPAGWRSMSHSSNPLKLVSWPWGWVNRTPMASTVTRSRSNRASLDCDGKGDSHHGWVILSLQYRPSVLVMFPAPC